MDPTSGKAIVSATTRLWDLVEKYGLAPLLGNRLARAEGDRIRILAQADRDADAIRAGTLTVPLAKATTLPLAGPPQPDQLSDRTAVIRAIEDARLLTHEINVARAVLHASETLSSDDQNSTDTRCDKEPDEDWLNRWRGAASEVSTEHLQHLWGRVLAGEFKQPGTFSLRTVDALRNMSVEEARLVGRLRRLVIAGTIFRERNDEDELSFEDGLKLEEIGVLSGISTGLNMTFTSREPTRFFIYLFAHDRGLQIEHADSTRKLVLSQCGVTRIGHELLQLVEDQSIDPAYLTKVAKRIATLGFVVHELTLRNLGDNRAEIISRNRIEA